MIGLLLMITNDLKVIGLPKMDDNWGVPITGLRTISMVLGCSLTDHSSCAKWSRRCRLRWQAAFRPSEEVVDLHQTRQMEVTRCCAPRELVELRTGEFYDEYWLISS